MWLWPDPDNDYETGLQRPGRPAYLAAFAPPTDVKATDPQTEAETRLWQDAFTRSFLFYHGHSRLAAADADRALERWRKQFQK